MTIPTINFPELNYSIYSSDNSLLAEIRDYSNFSTNNYNTYINEVQSNLVNAYSGVLSLSASLSKLVEFKRSRISYYLREISELVDSMNSVLFNKTSNIFILPTHGYHYINQAETSARINKGEGTIQINETKKGYRIPLENIVKDEDVSMYVKDNPSMYSFVELGSEIKNLFLDVYNYYKLIVRSPEKKSITLVVDIEIPEQYVSSIRLYMDHINPYIDKIKVSYKNSATVQEFTTTVDNYFYGQITECFIGNDVDTLRIEIIKATNNTMSFSNSVVYFDYFFTFFLIEFFNKRYYRQNVLVTKPLAFDNSQLGVACNSVKFGASVKEPPETGVRFFYYKVNRGRYGQLPPTNPKDMKSVRNGDSIELVSYDRILLAENAFITRNYDINYSYLDVGVEADKILNAGIYCFRGPNKYTQVGENFYRVYLIKTTPQYLEIDFDDYCDSGYLDKNKITGSTFSINRGFYVLAVETEDIDTYMAYLVGLSSGLFLAQDRLLFGYPSEILSGSYPNGFTIIMDSGRTTGKLLVKTPSIDEISKRYLVLYDKRIETT
jgi:hypothetical protein